MNKSQFIKTVGSKFLIGEVAKEIKAGFACGKFELGNGDIPHFRPMNISNDCCFTWEGTKFISFDYLHDKTDFSLKKGDILFNNTNSTELVGKSCYISDDYECGFSNHMTRIRVKEKIVDSYYLSQLFFGMWKNRVFESYCHKWVNQSGINTEILSNIPILLPPLVEQQRIGGLLQRIEQSVIRAEEQEKSLLKLKNQLLHELVGKRKQFGDFLTVTDYEKVKFEKIAQNISERVEPKQTELDIYVGLEHLDADDLIIRRRGTPDDVIGTKLKIFKKDIIFGKRRAYLRKVAVSDFEGIVSAHSMVLRANEHNIEKEFLPYFMQSDEFMSRAVQISEGSLSPTIKWKTLAQQEFVLPKKEKQSKLIEVFMQFDITREQLRTQIQTLKTLKQKLLNEILGG